jgi:hypothetical protein
MVVRTKRAVAHAREQLGERRVASEVAAHDERVGEVADEWFGLDVCASGAARTDENRLPATVAMQHGHVRREQQLIQRGVVLPRERLERVERLRLDDDGACVHRRT